MRTKAGKKRNKNSNTLGDRRARTLVVVTYSVIRTVFWGTDLYSKVTRCNCYNLLPLYPATAKIGLHLPRNKLMLCQSGPVYTQQSHTTALREFCSPHFPLEIWVVVLQGKQDGCRITENILQWNCYHWLLLLLLPDWWPAISDAS